MTPPRAARAIADSVPGSRLVNIEGSGHALMAEKPDAVLDALRAFMT
jgi:pimeloyl-ACP methyl ester carboxylesterase